MENNQKMLPSHKRRSSIFQSRLVTFDQDKGNLETSNNQHRNFSLEEYMNYLKEERRNWQCVYKERKKQRRHFVKKRKNIGMYGQDFDQNILSDSETTFFFVAPDYNQTCANFAKLLNMTVKIAILSQLHNKLNKTFLLKMEEKICNLTRTVIETTKVYN